VRLNLWFLLIYWGDLGGFRPCVMVRFPRRWLMVFLGWQRPDLLWMTR